MPKLSYSVPLAEALELMYPEQLCLSGSAGGESPDYDVIDPSFLDFEAFDILAW